MAPFENSETPVTMKFERCQYCNWYYLYTTQNELRTHLSSTEVPYRSYHEHRLAGHTVHASNL